MARTILKEVASVAWKLKISFAHVFFYFFNNIILRFVGKLHLKSLMVTFDGVIRWSFQDVFHSRRFFILEGRHLVDFEAYFCFVARCMQMLFSCDMRWVLPRVLERMVLQSWCSNCKYLSLFCYIFIWINMLKLLVNQNMVAQALGLRTKHNIIFFDRRGVVLHRHLVVQLLTYRRRNAILQFLRESILAIFR